MTLQPSYEDQELLADTRRRARARATAGELLGELIAGAGFVAATAALWWVDPVSRVALGPCALCLMVLVIASRIRFETPFGFTVATQLAFVPLLFVTPAPIVPLAVAGALSLAWLPEVLRRRIPPRLLLRMPGNSWFAIGPAAVFAVRGVTPMHASAPVLLLALAAQFAGDFVFSALRFAIAREAAIRTQLRESGWVYGIDVALCGVGLLVARATQSSSFAVLAVVPLLGVLAIFARERQARLHSLLELNDTYRGTALLLGDVIAADDGYTGEHSQGVVDLARAVGEALGLDVEQRRNLEFAALLHDIGKIAIPKEIINKPGKLDPGEWELMKTHSAEGERMLNQVGGFMQDVGRIVRSHHERWDGRGYPDGLVAERVPLEARIITACDSWSAMRTDRSYRRALPLGVARQEIIDNIASQFDPRVAYALLSVVGGDVSSDAAAPEHPETGRSEQLPVAAVLPA